MSRQSDPVPALDRSHLLFQILYDDDLTAFLVGESGQTEGIHENLRQSTVKTSPDSTQLLRAFLRKRVPQILRHDPITERYVRRLEQKIREYPDLWMWSHKRWKHKSPADLARMECERKQK